MNRQMTQGTVANNVQVIPATKRRVSAGGQLKKAKDIRVAAYGRVSTDELAQQTSYEGQKSYYTKLINEKEGWTFAGMYADEAISGTNRNHRTEFNQMMQDALDGKIDYIITKSISRFARNTVDTLNCVRQLRQCDPPIGVYFEKENIDTLDASGELLLTILSALAQEESNSISKNISWSIQKRFQEGIAFGNPRSVYGYTDGETNKDWVIVEEQARVVRFIFDEFLLGKSSYKISNELNEKGIALFDTASSIRRLQDNASDKFLEVVEATDVTALLRQLPECKAIVTTGQKATDTLRQQFNVEEPKVGDYSEFIFEGRAMRLYRMPSSSRAYPLALDKKATAYRIMYQDLQILF